MTLGDYQIQVNLEERRIDDSLNEANKINEVGEKVAIENLAHDNFGLNASDLLKESVSSEFQLDIGLMDDFLDAPTSHSQDDREEEKRPSHTPISHESMRKTYKRLLEVWVSILIWSRM